MRKRISNNYVLGACVAVMMLLCALSVGQPILFGKRVELREAEVKARLLQIRAAEEKYKARHGVYTADFTTLVKGRYLSRECQYIPYTEGKRFSLAATSLVGKSGRQVPLMECGAAYADYLDGLDEEAVRQLTENATYAGLYPGLRVGDITSDNGNAPNW